MMSVARRPKMRTHPARDRDREKVAPRSRYGSSPTPTFLTAVGIEETPPFSSAAVRSPLVKSWEYPNDCLEGFVHDMASLLTSKRLRLLEWQFEQNNSRASLLQFIQMMLVILQPYIPQRQYPQASSTLSLYSVEELRLVHLLTDMFAQMDADVDGVLHWEEFTSFLIAVHATAERPSQPNRHCSQRYLRGNNVRPAIERSDVPCLRKIAYLATSVLTPRNAIHKVYHFPGTDVVAAVEQEGRRASLYSPTGLRCLGTLQPAEADDRIQCVAHVPLMRCYAVVNSRPALCLYHDGTRALRVTVPLRRPPLCLATVEMGSREGLLFGGHADGRVYGCRLSTWESEVQWADLLPSVKHMHTDAVVDTMWSSTAEAVATASMDCVVKLWDLEKQECRQTFMGHNRGVKALASNEGLRLLFSGGFDSEVLVWSPRLSGPVTRLQGHKHAVVKVQSVDSSFELFSADASGMIKLWDVRNYQCIQTMRKDEAAQPLTDFVALGPRHRRLVTASNTLQVFNLHGSQAAAAEHAISAVFNMTSTTVMMTSNQETRIWDAISGSLIRVYSHINDDERASLTAACLDGRRRKLLVGDTQGTIKAYDYCTGTLLKSMTTRLRPCPTKVVEAVPQPRHGVGVTHMVYAPEHRTVISACSDRSLCIHDESQPYIGALLRRIEKVHDAPIASLAYQAGVMVTGAMTTGEVKVWDYASGRLEGCCLGHTSTVVSIEFLDPYPALLTADTSGHIIIWGMRPCVFAFQKLYSWSQSGVGVSRTCLYRIRACDKKQMRRDEKAQKAAEEGEKPLNFRQEAMYYEKYRYRKAEAVAGAVSSKQPTAEEAMASFASIFATRSPILADYRLIIGDEAGSVSVWDVRSLLELLGRHYLHRLDNANNTRPVKREPHNAGVQSPRQATAPSTKTSRAQSPPTALFTFSESHAASFSLSPSAGRTQGLGSPRSPDPRGATLSPRAKADSPRPPFRVRNITSPSAARVTGTRSPDPLAGQVMSPRQGLLSPAAGAALPSCARVDGDSREMEAARRAAADLHVPLVAMWQAYDAPIVSIQTIIDPPAVLTCAADKTTRLWSFKGVPLGELTVGKPTGWRLPVKRKLLEERRLQAAAVTLDSLTREMNLAAEHALAMAEQEQHKTLAVKANSPAGPTVAAALQPAAAMEAPAATSLTHRILSFEKIVATAEVEPQKRNHAERLAPPSPPPRTDNRPRPKLRGITRLVQNATRFIRTAKFKGTGRSQYSQGMRTVGRLSARAFPTPIASQTTISGGSGTVNTQGSGAPNDPEETGVQFNSAPSTDPSSQTPGGGTAAAQAHGQALHNMGCGAAPVAAEVTATRLPNVGAVAGLPVSEPRAHQPADSEEPRLRPCPPGKPLCSGGRPAGPQRPGFGRRLRAVEISANMTAGDAEDDMAALERGAARLEHERKTLMRLLSPCDPVGDEATDPRMAVLRQAFMRRESDGFSTTQAGTGRFAIRRESTLSLEDEVLKTGE